MQKSDKLIKNLQVNFENNQNFTIIENGSMILDSVNVNFQNNGLQTLTATVIYQDSSTQTTYSNFNVITSTNRNSTNQNIQTITATKPFRGYNEPADCNGSCYGQGEYKVYLASNHSQITKPFIIVDGFDSGDKRKIDAEQSGNPDDENTIRFMMKYAANRDLIRELNQRNYDVIILNFPKYIINSYTDTAYDDYDYENGTIEEEYTVNVYRDGGVDYIERNAKVVEALLDHVNQQLTNNGSNEKIIIAGPSMGALVVQYALAEMEEDNENHNVSLYISFDGPHKGANVPIGIQKAVKYFSVGSGLIEHYTRSGASTFLGVINSPAAKQMLIHHYLSSSNYNQGCPNFRNRFQTELNTLGLPHYCKNVAILNGTSTGTLNNNPSSDMAYIHFSLLSTTPYWDDGFLRRTLWVKNSTNNGSSLVFRFLKENWWGAHVQADIKKYAYTPSNKGSLGAAPGGYFKLLGRLNNCNDHIYNFPWNYLDLEAYVFCTIDNNNDLSDWKKFWKKLGFSFIYSNVVDSNGFIIDLKNNFSFVPSKSAIYFEGQNTSWNENWGCRNLVCTNETPFDSYFVPDHNTEHASLSQESVQWLKQALTSIETNQTLPPPPLYGTNCNPVNIVGASVICYNETKTYNVDSTCPIPNISWSVSNGLQIISTSSYSITVKNINQNSHNLSITAHYGNNSLTKNLVNKPSFNIITNNNTSSYTITLHGLGVDIQNQDIQQITWEKLSGNGHLATPLNSFTTHAFGNSDNNWYVQGKVTVCNSCGCTEKTFIVVGGMDNPCDPNPPKLLLLPENNNQYRVIDPCDPSTEQNISRAEIYDQFGIKLNDANINGDRVSVNNSGTGIKIIKVSNNQKEGSKLIINQQN